MRMINEAQIKKEAKEIMDNFMKSLDSIEIEEEFVLDRNESFREEDIVLENEVDKEHYLNDFLKNASKTKGNAILANKGEWVK